MLESINDDSNTLTDEEAVEVPDPDDIDALLDSINDDSNTLTDEEAIEVSDPDDIDALLDSINDDKDTLKAEDKVEEDIEVSDAEEASRLEDINESKAIIDQVGTLDSDVISNNDIATSDTPDIENTDLINDFTDEYVQSFIDTDFSKLSDDSADESLEELDAPELDENLGKKPQHENSSDGSEEISDDFDIDALIDEVNHSPEANDEPLEIGDDVLDTDLLDSELLSEDKSNLSEEPESETIDEETLQALSGDFDESTLANLLNDEIDAVDKVELSPDFTDRNVLADLLADDDNHTQNDIGKSVASNAEEVDGMKELDNLDFDDLLANIEEESSQSDSDEFEFSEEFEIGDDFELDTAEEDSEPEGNDSAKESEDKDFISVDSLLSDSLLDGKPTEPYEKMNIDVGLSEFPEFSGNITEDDVDDDDNGIAAKLDLAKVYIEIGDHDNAEVILLDVIKLGDAQQQFDAQQLLDNLKD